MEIRNDSLELRQMQAWMQRALIGSEATSAAQPDAIIRTSSRLSAGQHLDIYRRSYVARLRECMAAQFSALNYALGPELFRAFADDYLQSYPSASYTLNDLGARFAQFLSDTRPDAHEAEKELWPDFMIELAAFEFALAQIFDEQEPASYETAGLNTPDKNLVPNPILHLFRHTHPVCAYYLEVTHGHEPELPLPIESYCAVVRVHYQLGLFPLNREQYLLLQLVKQYGAVSAALPEFFGAGYSEAQFGEVWPVWKKYLTESRCLISGNTL